MVLHIFEETTWPVAKLCPTRILAITAPICIAATIFIRHTIKQLPLPPSPPLKYWFGGHSYLLPKPGDKELFWQVFTKLAQQYGDVVHLSVDGEDTIILSSHEAINELFVTRGAIYSDRRFEPWITDIMGWGKVTSFRNHDEGWRKSLRLTNVGFSKQAADSYHATQAKNVHQFLQRITSNPNEWEKELNRMIAEIIMRIVYGYPVSDSSDPLIKIVYDALASVQRIRTYTSSWTLSIIKRFPIVCSFPSWLPGMGWKRELMRERHWPEEMVDRPWKWTKDRLATGNVSPSFVSQLLEMNSDGLEGEDLIKWVSGTMFIAGSHTSSATICNFILAMVLHPEVMKKAREEMDRVVGLERLPGMADQEKLPYLECLILEVMRWRMVVPLSLPHRTIVEDRYKGYRIPAGSVVISNLHAVMHDASLFPNPHLFKPERFLDENTQDTISAKSFLNPRDVIFGIGRRSCPGFRVASATVFLTVACLVATMDFGRVEGDEGNLDVGYTSGFIAMPLPFKCSIKPRSEAAVRLINETVLFEQE